MKRLLFALIAFISAPALAKPERPLRPNYNISNVVKSGVYRYIDAKDEATGLRIDGLKLRYGRSAIRIDGDAHNIIIKRADLTLANPTRGSDLPVGIDLRGTVHDVLIADSASINNQMVAAGGYTNGDGFSTERGVYRVTFERCVSNDNSDGGFDTKSRNTAFNATSAARNYRNYRLWGSGSMTDATSINPRGAHIWVGSGSGNWTIARPVFVGPKAHLQIDGGTAGQVITIIGGTVDGKPIMSLKDLRVVRSGTGKLTKLVFQP